MHIHLMGRHANRTPFSYPAYRSILEGRFSYVDDAMRADLIVLGYVVDIDKNISTLEQLKSRNPSCRILVVSEEPLWDTTNSGDFWKRHNRHVVGRYSFDYSVINHHTSNLYDFERFPYFLTTNDEFYLRYSHAFARNAALDARQQLAIWQQASIRQAFFAESRDLTQKYAVSLPEIATWGLSVYRTDIAKAMPDAGTLRVGQGWGSAAPRQALADWHLDKLTSLKSRSLIVSAIENTNQRNYISEKIFDAYAVCAVPLYWHDASHRVTELATPGSFLNLFGQAPEQAAKTILDFEPDRVFVETYLAAQNALKERFRFYDDYIEERLSFAERLSDEVNAIVSEEQKGA